MTVWHWLAVGAAAYAAVVLALVVAGRSQGARALAGFIPDCLVLIRRLIADPRVAWWRKALLGALVAYLASPIDLVPDFIPVAGQLDDAIVALLVMRIVISGSTVAIAGEHWAESRRGCLGSRHMSQVIGPS